jgi:hypothetical protein
MSRHVADCGHCLVRIGLERYKRDDNVVSRRGLAITAAPGTAKAVPTPSGLVSDPASLVDPMIGTGSGGATVGQIDTFPGASAPFGMLTFSPDTPSRRDGGGYNYADNSIVGFSLTHLSGSSSGDPAPVRARERHGLACRQGPAISSAASARDVRADGSSQESGLAGHGVRGHCGRRRRRACRCPARTRRMCAAGTRPEGTGPGTAKRAAVAGRSGVQAGRRRRHYEQREE